MLNIFGMNEAIALFPDRDFYSRGGAVPVSGDHARVELPEADPEATVYLWEPRLENIHIHQPSISIKKIGEYI